MVRTYEYSHSLCAFFFGIVGFVGASLTFDYDHQLFWALSGVAFPGFVCPAGERRVSRMAINELRATEPLFHSASDAEAFAYLEKEGHDQRLRERRNSKTRTAAHQKRINATCSGATNGDYLPATPFLNQGRL